MLLVGILLLVWKVKAFRVQEYALKMSAILCGSTGGISEILKSKSTRAKMYDSGNYSVTEICTMEAKMVIAMILLVGWTIAKAVMMDGVIGIIVILMNCNIIVMLHLCSLLIFCTQKLRKHYLK